MNRVDARYVVCKESLTPNYAVKKKNDFSHGCLIISFLKDIDCEDMKKNIVLANCKSNCLYLNLKYQKESKLEYFNTK